MSEFLLSSYTLDDLKAVIKEILLETKEAHTQSSPKNYIHGIGELARFLKCSRPTAQRYKNSGVIPYSQTGRKIVFDADEVLKAMQRKGGIIQ